MNKDTLRNIANNLPNKPGVYQFFNKEEVIIYIGKAKNLTKRVGSYFSKKHDSGKTAILVRHITRIEHIIVETETDALLLESNLIKKYKPRYNILLKDDKSYPWICIKKEQFPRVFQTRDVIKDGSEYFGPYTSLHLVRTMITMFRKVYLLRTCKLNLELENINKGKFKVCLEYHIKNCKAPCINQQSEEDYNKSINDIREILKGKVHKVISYLTKEMNNFANKYEFEEAKKIKERIDLLDNYQSKSTIVNSSINNVDVFSILDAEKYAYVNFLKVINGKIIQAHSFEIKKKLDESKEEILLTAIVNIRQSKQKGVSNAEEILVPFELNYNFNYSVFKVPKIGDKKKLLDLSLRNLKYFKFDKEKQKSNLDPQKRINRILETMQKELRLPVKPTHIECFDNSNLQGTNAVAACVVLRDTRPSKKEYRKFNIKTVVGIDDFASMREIVFRRYKRLLEEKKELPQLVIVDGGKGQLSSAYEILKTLKIENKIALIGIAKRLEEIFFPEENIPLYLDKNSETLKVIQRARDEAHRFGITFHRNKRSKSMLNTELYNIDGIGKKTVEILLLKLKSVKNVKNADFESLKAIIGNSKAKIISEYFAKL